MIQREDNQMTTDRRSLLKLAGGIAAASALPGAAKAQDRITWKAVANHRLGAAWAHRWPWLVEELRNRTGGRLNLDVTTVPELGFTGQELLRALRSNIVDFADVVGGYVGGDFPAIEGPQLPGIFVDYAAQRRAVESWQERIIAPRGDVMGGRVVASFNYNSVYLFSKFPVERLEDLRGKKIRTFSTSLVDYVGALGGEPVSLPVADLYTALERGTIQGAITGPDQVEGQRLYEVCGHMTDLLLGSSPGYSVVSRRSFERLPADLRPVFERISAAFTDRGWEAGEINNRNGIQLARDRGMNILLSPKEEWRPALNRIARETVVPRWARRVGGAAVREFNDVLGPIAGFTI
jgi:TRAP-type C4-dicarboxylate transport system substrate-binding protein